MQRNKLAFSIEEQCNGISCIESSFGKIFVTILDHSGDLKIFQRLFLHDLPASMGADSFAILQDLVFLKAQNTILN